MYQPRQCEKRVNFYENVQGKKLNNVVKKKAIVEQGAPH